MDIKTKFNVGEECFTISSRAVRNPDKCSACGHGTENYSYLTEISSVIVDRIEITITNTINIKYCARHCPGGLGVLGFKYEHGTPENRLLKSKQEAELYL